MIFLLLNHEGHELRCIVKIESKKDLLWVKDTFKIGDFVVCSGEIVVGKDGNNELLVSKVDILKKNLLSSVETGLLPDSCFRGKKLKQYYHLMMLTDVDCFCYLKVRSCILHVLNQKMIEYGFCNIMTPVLQHNFYAGGSKPFITHMLDNGSDMYLRITSEIALKLITVGGIEKVFEIGYYFRNCSINEKHCVPFCAMEAYQTQVSYKQMQIYAEELLKTISHNIIDLFKGYGKEVRISFDDIQECTFEEFVRLCGFDNFDISDLNTYPDIPELSEKSEDIYMNSRVLYKWLKSTLIKRQINPLWISDLPTSASPFIKKKDRYRLYRKYLIANGATLVEIAQGETDSKIIENNLYQQQYYQKNDYPHDYQALIHAYRLGVPDIASLFIGIDRLYSTFAGEDDINRFKMYI